LQSIRSELFFSITKTKEDDILGQPLRLKHRLDGGNGKMGKVICNSLNMFFGWLFYFCKKRKDAREFN
jgi:hypothetical protein